MDSDANRPASEDQLLNPILPDQHGWKPEYLKKVKINSLTPLTYRESCLTLEREHCRKQFPSGHEERLCNIRINGGL